jgi:hypothetical protein
MSHQLNPKQYFVVSQFNEFLSCFAAMSSEILRDKLTADEYEPDLQISLTPEEQERKNRARFLRAATRYQELPTP